MKRALVLAVLGALGLAVPACGEDELVFPVATAAPSRHTALRDALVTDARAFAFENGDWLEDLGDAPAFGLAVLARRADLAPEEIARRDAALARARTLLAGDPLAGDAEEKAMAAFGLLESLAARAGTDVSADAALVEGYLDRVDVALRGFGDDLANASGTLPAVRDRGATVALGFVALLHAQAALVIGGARADAHRDRALALENRLQATSFGDLADPGSGRTARAYAANPGEAGLALLPNVVMMLLDARLFRLTKDETYRLGARALFAALQPLVLPASPRRYTEPEVQAPLGAQGREAVTLAGQSALVLAALATFEVTGDARYVNEADALLDGIEQMRGPFCTKDLACAASACGPDRCATSLLHHEIDGKLASPTSPGRVFCAGCALEALYAVGSRRMAAGEPF